MGFWTGVGDWFGFKPIEDVGDFFQDAASFATMGMYRADDNSFNLPLGSPVTGGIQGVLRDGVDNFANAVSSTLGGNIEAMNTLKENGLGDYIGNLFQSDADAALDQAMTNEMLSENAWKRSEQSAEAAQQRAYQYLENYHSHLMKGLKDAGLNPVLAASSGIGGVSASAPQGTSQAATSSKAEGLNAATLLRAIAAILSGAGSLLTGKGRLLDAL